MPAGKYIVLFKKGTPIEVINEAADKVIVAGGSITHRYDTAVSGFSATLPDDHIQTLQVNEHIDCIEGDGEVTTFAKSLGIN